MPATSTATTRKTPSSIFSCPAPRGGRAGLKIHVLVLFLLGPASSLFASSYAPGITLSLRQAELKKVFGLIEQQTSYLFFYSEESLQKARPVDINVRDASLEQVLIICFKDQPFTYQLINQQVVVKEKGEAQRTGSPPDSLTRVLVNGLVASADSARTALPGATVRNLSAQKVSLTNGEGRFSLSVRRGDALEVTYVGYKKRTLVIADMNQPLAVYLETDVVQHQEVVVTAFGIEKDVKKLGYSVAKITGEELVRTNPTNLLTGLAGKIPGMAVSTLGSGVNPQMRVLLRGLRSPGESANNLPLFVLNGVPLSFGADAEAANLAMDFINNINPADVENISVLKGANGAAVYGPEGVNGVILITTKKGKSIPQITFRHSTTLQQKDFRYPRFQQQFGAGSAVDAFGDGIYTPYPFDPTRRGSWGSAYTGELLPIGRPDEEGNLQRVPYRFTREREKFWNLARTIQNDLSFSRGDERSDFYLGLSNTDITGLIPDDHSSRNSVLLNAGTDLGRGISIRTNLGYTRRLLDVTSRGSLVASLVNATPAHIPLTRYKDFAGDKWADRNHYYDEYSPNPYEVIAGNRQETTENAFFGNLQFQGKFFRWLTVTERLGVNYSGRSYKQTTQEIFYSDFAKNSGRYISSVEGDRFGAVRDVFEYNSTLNNDLLLTAQHTLGAFSLTNLVGHSVRQSSYNYLAGDAGQLAVPVFNLVYSIDPALAQERNRLTRALSVFGTSTLGYKDRAFLELTARQDWDSKVARAALNQTFYYGVNTSVLLTEVFPRLARVPYLSTAKLRAAVTRTANMNISPYQSETILELTTRFPIRRVVSYNFRPDLANPLIVPERIISQEYGAELYFLNNRVKLEATYYRQLNNGFIVRIPLSGWTGFTWRTINAGRFRNHGWELSLQATPLFKIGSFSAALDASLATNDNKILSLGDNGQDIRLVNIIGRAGGRAYEYPLVDWARDPEGRVIVDRLTGMPSPDFRNPRITGRTLPKYIAGFNLHLYWKRLGLHAVGEYRGGYQHLFNVAGSRIAAGDDPLTALNGRQRFIIPNSVYESGDGQYVENTDVAIRSIAAFYQGFNTNQTHSYASGAFWKLRELVLNYEIPFRSKWVKKVTLGATTRNLLLLYPRSNRWGDPELVTGPGSEEVQSSRAAAASNASGAFTDEDTIGGTRFYGFNVNVNF